MMMTKISEEDHKRMYLRALHEEEIASEMRKGLIEYGVHKSNCKKWWHHQIEGSHLQADKECTCGLEKLIQMS